MSLLKENDYLLEKINKTELYINSIILSKQEVVRKSLICFFSGGHLLLEDLPGSGKTTLAKTLAEIFLLENKRIQFTSDLLPSDIIGVNVFNQNKLAFDFKKGPVFTNILLADEINRCSPKTQSSLLEAMEEKQVSIDGVTYLLKTPFFVIATQNPVDLSGTFPLPDSQLDRFLFKLSMGYPSKESELSILKRQNQKPKLTFQWSIDEINKILEICKSSEIYTSDNIIHYIYNLISETRNTNVFKSGLSTRAGLALVNAAKVSALMDKRNSVLPKDINFIFQSLAAHRLQLSSRNENNYSNVNDALKEIMEKYSKNS